MCLDAAASDIEKGCASWPTVRSPSARSRSICRRVASPRAWKTESSWGVCNSTMWLNVEVRFWNVNQLVELFFDTLVLTNILADTNYLAMVEIATVDTVM